MQEKRILFKKLYPEAIPFSYTRKGDACMDMFALEDGHINAHETKLIQTGIAIELPKGYEGIIRGRSGLALKGILSHIGTIDETYRGDVGIILFNTTDTFYDYKAGDRLAQFTIKPVTQDVNMVEQLVLSETIRNTKGFGSSGV